MTDTILTPNEAAELVKTRWYLEGAVTGGKITVEMMEAVRKAEAHLAGQVAASALLNGHKKEETKP